MPQKITHSYCRAMKALGFDSSLHGLRHYHVSELIAGNVDILTISRRIGHSNAATTLRVYGHAIENTDARAAEIMEAAFAKVHGR